MNKPESGYAILLKLDKEIVPVIEDGKLYLITEDDSIDGLEYLSFNLHLVQTIIANEIKERKATKKNKYKINENNT